MEPYGVNGGLAPYEVTPRRRHRNYFAFVARKVRLFVVETVLREIVRQET